MRSYMSTIQYLSLQKRMLCTHTILFMLHIRIKNEHDDGNSGKQNEPWITYDKHDTPQSKACECGSVQFGWTGWLYITREIHTSKKLFIFSRYVAPLLKRRAACRLPNLVESCTHGENVKRFALERLPHWAAKRKTRKWACETLEHEKSQGAEALKAMGYEKPQ